MEGVVDTVYYGFVRECRTYQESVNIINLLSAGLVVNYWSQ